MPKPSIGRIVHHVEGPNTRCLAAVITDVQEDYGEMPVSLFVMAPAGTYSEYRVPYSEQTNIGYTWHWPERVEE